MAKKPTYEELEKKVRELEKRESALKQKLINAENASDLLYLFLKHSPIYAFLKEVSNNQSRVIYASDNFIDIIGIPASEMIGKTMDELFPEEFAQKITHDEMDVIQRGDSIIIEEDFNERNYVTFKYPISKRDKKYLAGYTVDITDRKQVEEALRESEKNLMLAQSIVHIGSWKYEIETKELQWSDELYRIYGLDPETTKATLDHGIGMIHPADRKYAEDVFAKAVNDGEPYTIQYKIIQPDGTERVIEGIGKIEKDQNGNVLCVYGTGQDITDRAEAKKALSEKDTMLANIASQVPGMLYQFKMAPDGSFSVPYSSNGVKDIFGCTPEDVRDDFDPIFNAIHPEDRHEILQTIDESAKSMSQWKCEYRVQVSGQPMKWVFGNSIPDKKPDGSIVWSGYNVDITEYKRVEAALRESEEQFRHFFEHLTIGVAVYEAVDDGSDFIFLDMNPAGQKFSEVSLENIRGKRLTQVFPGVGKLGLLQTLQDVWRTGKPGYVPFRQYEDDRIAQWVENRVFRLPSGKVVTVYDDRTEQMRLEEGLRQAQKMEAIGTLAGGIAHDFNNMLSILIGNISYALSILNKEDKLFEVLSDAMRGTKHAQTLTNQLLTFAKGGDPIKKTCDINTLLEETATFVTSGAKSVCNFNLAEDLWSTDVDAGQINQAISNLIINADQAMPDGGIISIGTKNIKLGTAEDFQLPPGKYVKIAVADQGIGIREKHIPNIFDPYFTTKQKGSGLGLATAYSIIKKHGGHITVYSEDGKGTVFTIYLPASLKEIEEIKDKEEREHRGHGRILIMDDQEQILRMVERMLGRMGYETITATDGAKAIELYREAYNSGNPFDLVILDLTVPAGMGGAKTIPELLKIDPEVKAVVSSGYSNDPIMANYKDYGFCGVIPKPYSKDEMAKLLNTVFH